MKQELIDLVNENDEVIGVINRHDANFNGTKNIRSVNLFLITKDGKIVVPKRSSNKSIYPNCYDFSAAGMVDKGEDYETAMYRELKEELLLENISLKEIAYFNPFKHGVSIFFKLYIGFINCEIRTFDKNEVAEVFYLTINEIEKLLKESPHLFKSVYELSFKTLKNYLKNNR